MEQIIDTIHINFDTTSLWILNLALALVMFGVALEIKLEDTNKNINHTYAPLGTDCIEYIELDLEYIESIKKKQINVEIKKAD